MSEDREPYQEPTREQRLRAELADIEAKEAALADERRKVERMLALELDMGVLELRRKLKAEAGEKARE